MLFKNTHCQSATSDCKTEFYQPLCMSKRWSASSRLPMFLTWPVPQTEWFQTEHKRMPLLQGNDLGWINEFSVLHSYLKENQTSTLSFPPGLIFFGSSSPHKYLFSPSPFPSPSLSLFSSLSLVSLPHLPLFLSVSQQLLLLKTEKRAHHRKHLLHKCEELCLNLQHPLRRGAVEQVCGQSVLQSGRWKEEHPQRLAAERACLALPVANNTETLYPTR